MQLLKLKDERTPLWLGAILFALIGIVQTFRFFGQWPLSVDNHPIPLLPSAIAAIVTLGMAYWLAYTAKVRLAK